MAAEAAQANELLADIKELKTMIASASRPNVRKEMQRVLDMLEAELRRLNPKLLETTVDVDAAAVSEASSSAKEPSKPAAAVVQKKEEPHVPVAIDVRSSGPWAEITTFALDLGGYDKQDVTVDIRMKGVEALSADAVVCDFTRESFDLKVMGFEGKNHRMLKTNLDKDIIPGESSVKIKKNHVIVVLKKVKGKYGFDSWTDLCAKGKRRPTQTEEKKSDPQAGIMDMMKDMYDDGDENMKKIIGEAMYKAQRGEKYEPKTDAFGGMKDDDMKMPDLDSDI